ncbi:hypothetical protein EBR44_11795 [bacterium]|nr:hypothetical protein [bacterium]
MNNDLEALLALQADDVVIHGLDARLESLEPRIRELDLRRARLTDALARSASAVADEEKKQAWVRDKIAEHKALIERNASQLDADRIRVRRQPEAVFAMNGYSCGACDTAIPMQRRHSMSTTGAIDVCEGCGVLMYFPS